MSRDEVSPFHHVARLETHLIAASCITLAATDAVILGSDVLDPAEDTFVASLPRRRRYGLPPCHAMERR